MFLIEWAATIVAAFFLFKFGFKFLNKSDVLKSFDEERWPALPILQTDKNRKKIALVICFIPGFNIILGVLFFMISLVIGKDIESIFDK